MGWIGCVYCEKFQCDFLAQTRAALIAQVRPIFHRVPCSINTLPNAPKCYATQQNKTKQEFRVHLVGSGVFIAKNSKATSLNRVSCINERIQNAPKHYKKHQNMSLRSNGVDRVCSLPKIPMRLRGTNFCINCSSSARFASSFMQ